MKDRTIELLAPAGSFETFQAVLLAGADAVYAGGSRFGARAFADNFTREQLLFAISLAHLHGRKFYLTVNTLLKERELEEELYEYLLPCVNEGLDAVIVQDIGALSLIREVFPTLSVHASTQMTITGPSGAKWLQDIGVSRIVTARELSLDEIKEIRTETNLEIETFVHGALCYCYSGQCLFSSMLGGRSGNRGRCAQPCRLSYEVFDERFKKQPQRGTYLLSPKDLCTVNSIPEFYECGVDSFKIEGRMKQAEYAAGVVSIYRASLDCFLNDCAKFGFSEAKARYKTKKTDLQRLSDLGNRSGFTDGYLYRRNGREMITYGKPSHEKKREDPLSSKWRGEKTAELKEKIEGILILKKELSATLTVRCRGREVCATAGTTESAQKKPLSREQAASQIKKTGNTPFVFEKLTIDMDEDAFVPVSTLKQLRRDALAQLFEALCANENHNRYSMQKICRLSIDYDGFPAKTTEENKKFSLVVSIAQRSQLFAALEFSFSEAIYLDSSCYTRELIWVQLEEDVKRIHKYHKKAYLIFPAVFRSETAEFYRNHKKQLKEMRLDGIVVRSFDGASFLKDELQNVLPVILDFGMYTYNNRAKSFLWRAYHPLRDTAPLELNKKELSERDNRGTEALVYGRIPLMISAQCIAVNTETCGRKNRIFYLKDRYRKYFPVKTDCADCCNTIYNASVLNLLGYVEELKQAGVRYGRISFTMESEKEVRHVLQSCQQVIEQGADFKEQFPGEYTYGHYKRGVD